MKNFQTTKKNKKTQYIIASIVAVIILFMWVSLPLINRTSGSGSKYSNGFSKKSADLSLLGDNIGGDAPGNPLSGELIDNPATSLDMQAASLFGYQDSSSNTDQNNSSQSQNSGSSFSDSNVSAPSPSTNNGFKPKGKLNALPSLTSGNSNSNTIGSNHSKFFGQENVKADFKSSDLSEIKPKSEKGSALMASLQNAKDQSLKAMKSSDLNTAKNSAASAFSSNVKAKDNNLLGAEEKKFAESGLELGKIDQDFKKSDPSLSKKTIKLPEPKPEKDNTQEEEMKQMIMQMLIQATVGQIFGAIGQSIAMGITGPMAKK